MHENLQTLFLKYWTRDTPGCLCAWLCVCGSREREVSFLRHNHIAPSQLWGLFSVASLSVQHMRIQIILNVQMLWLSHLSVQKSAFAHRNTYDCVTLFLLALLSLAHEPATDSTLKVCVCFFNYIFRVPHIVVIKKLL
jgi:hypothetical protein